MGETLRERYERAAARAAGLSAAALEAAALDMNEALAAEALGDVHEAWQEATQMAFSTSTWAAALSEQAVFVYSGAILESEAAWFASARAMPSWSAWVDASAAWYKAYLAWLMAELARARAWSRLDALPTPINTRSISAALDASNACELVADTAMAKTTGLERPERDRLAQKRLHRKD